MSRVALLASMDYSALELTDIPGSCISDPTPLPNLDAKLNTH